MSIRVTWWGHATTLVQDRARVLTDPVLTHRLAHLHRRTGLPPDPVPHDLDAVLVSHLHADHLHLPSLRMLPPGTPVLLPRGAARLLSRLPVEPVEVVAGDVVPVADARVRVVPAVHNDNRWPGGRIRGKAVGFVLEGDGSTYFAGDTSSFDGMADIHPDLDLALMPVGGWGPSLNGHHLNPRQAAECLLDLTPRVTVPIHYGTLWPRGMNRLRPHLFHDPGHRFAEHAEVLTPQVDVRVLAPGSSTVVEHNRSDLSTQPD
ncbi:MAG TPA: MBL fold metallo-hydrolase [Nocardioidaceae bacterium]|jgi:L-ascorbate metabolism protein UlaG (beta-lactamase superfamily)|nr:MBL fold metallo-hydrolase [Nocardioidaceae bacterium]